MVWLAILCKPIAPLNTCFSRFLPENVCEDLTGKTCRYVEIICQYKLHKLNHSMGLTLEELLFYRFCKLLCTNTEQKNLHESTEIFNLNLIS